MPKPSCGGVRTGISAEHCIAVAGFGSAGSVYVSAVGVGGMSPAVPSLRRPPSPHRPGALAVPPSCRTVARPLRVVAVGCPGRVP
jgi:hypothetical protein